MIILQWYILEAKHEATKVTELKIVTPKQMLQRLPIALAQVKTDNKSENLWNEIRQIVYSLYKSKEITEKVYNNIIKSIQLWKWILCLWIQKIVKLLNLMF